MEAILNQILSLITSHGSLAMILGGITEQIIVPIPSPIISMSGGALLTTPNSSLLSALFQVLTKTSLPYSLGAIIGTALIYFLCYFGGQPIIARFGKYIGVTWSLIEKIKSDFQKTISDELFILTAISIPVVPVSIITVFSGGFKIKPQKFFILAFIALVIRSTILGYIGHKMGETFTSLAQGLDKIESLLTVIIAFLVLGFLFFKRERWLKKNS